jgi:hypothetical protein
LSKTKPQHCVVDQEKRHRNESTASNC